MKREIKAVQFEVGLLCPIAASYTAPFSRMHCTKHIRIFKLGAAYMMVSIILSKVWMLLPSAFPHQIPYFWVSMAFPRVLYSHLVNLSECDQPQSMLRRTCNVLSLLAGQTLGSIHRLFLARVQEPRRVWKENSSREGFEHPAQRITWAKWHSCRVEHLE